MSIQWKVIKSKKLIRGTSPGFMYVVKHHRGNGWYGTRGQSWGDATHHIGPFVSKWECINALKTIDALLTPPPAPQRHHEYVSVTTPFDPRVWQQVYTINKGFIFKEQQNGKPSGKDSGDYVNRKPRNEVSPEPWWHAEARKRQGR